MSEPDLSGANDRNTARDGIVSAVLAYSMWGFLPIYFKIVADVATMEVLVHRVIWAVPFGALIIMARHQGAEVLAALTNLRVLGLLTLAAIFIAINWLIYIYAVQSGQIFQASLGYYINPLVYVLVGVAFFGERLGGLKLAAVLLASTGVAVLTVSGGQFPWIAVALAVLFTIYGVIRKKVDIGGMPGLFVETLVLLPLALLYLITLINTGTASFTPSDPVMMTTLILAGPITVLPLLFFALAARRLHLSTLGFLQFIGPTLQFVIALAYGEVLTTAHVVCFVLIWVAVSLFIVNAWRNR